MDEYIKKSDIKKAFLKGFTDRKKYPEFVNWMAKEAERIVSNMPYADVQPVIHSRWIPTGDGTYNAYCENCGQERGSKSWNKNDFKYCFGCGARMDGVANE